MSRKNLLSESEERFRAFMDNSPTIAWAKDEQGKHVYISRTYEKRFGVKLEDFRGKTDFDVFPAEIAREFRKNDLAVLQSGQPMEVFEYTTNADGSPCTWWDFKFLFRDAAGRRYVGGIGVDITEQRNMQEALRRSEQRFRNLVETTGDWVWETDKRGVYTYVSPRVQDLLGYAPEEVLGKTPFDFMPEHEGQRIASIFESIVAEGKPLRGLENVNRHKNGRLVVLETSGVPFFGADHQLLGYRGIDRDMTERKRFEERLQEEHDFCKAILDTAGALIVVLDPAGNIIRFNWECEKTTGFRPEEVIGKPFFDLFLTDEEREPVKKVFSQLQSGQFPMTYENYWVTKTGERRLISWSNTCVLSSAGEIVYVIGTGIDITERKRMEEELRKSHEELERRVEERTAEMKRQVELLNLASNAILVKKLDDVITFWNDGATEIYGWTKEEAVGRAARDLLKTQFPRARDEIFAQFIDEGSWQGELSHARKDGGKVYVLSRWTLQRDPQGVPIGVIDISHDITKRVKLEEQLRQSHKLEALGTLAGGIAHDLNNLLQPILINTELALSDIKGGAVPSLESLSLAREGARRAAELGRQIITFSRHKEQPRRPLAIVPLMKETLKFIKSTIPKNIKVVHRMDVKSAVILADPTQIHQVLMNLCNNAVHAMKEKGGVLEISLSTKEIDTPRASSQEGLEPGPYVLLTVKDNGHGMADRVRERAFDPFFTTKRPGEGSGMGLAVVHGIVMKHEGVIRLESEEGKGTAVNVFLPIFQGKANGMISSVRGEIPKGKERILLVDDERAQVRTLQSMLKRLGYSVTGESDPRRALEHFRSHPDAFDLVIADQVMPYLEGSQLSQELLALRPDIPIILCTGFSENMDEKKAGAMGIQGFLLKPFTMHEIAQAIRKALAPKRDS